MISVVMATYNRADKIKRAIESVLAQSYSDFEFIIINDASTDNTLGIINSYHDNRIRVISNEVNIGFVRSLNKGVGIARGKYIARIDDDDYWIDNDKLKKQADFLENNQEYILVGCNIIKNNKKFYFPQSDFKIRKRMMITSPFAHVAVMYSKNAFDRVRGYDVNLNLSQDVDLWMKLGKVGKMANLYFYGANINTGADSRTERNATEHILIKQKVRIRHRKDYPNFTLSYLAGWVIYLISFLPGQRKIRKFLRKIFIND